MNSMLIAIIAIAGLCGPRIQNGPKETREEIKKCQVEMVRCVKSKNTSVDEALTICMAELK